MDRRPTRWNPGGGAGNGSRGGSRSDGGPGSSAGGGMRTEHLIVTLIIIGAVLAIGLCMPLVWFDSVLAWIGFH